MDGAPGDRDDLASAHEELSEAIGDRLRVAALERQLRSCARQLVETGEFQSRVRTIARDYGRANRATAEWSAACQARFIQPIVNRAVP